MTDKKTDLEKIRVKSMSADMYMDEIPFNQWRPMVEEEIYRIDLATRVSKHRYRFNRYYED
jgi:hypothetical protein